MIKYIQLLSKTNKNAAFETLSQIRQQYEIPSVNVNNVTVNVKRVGAKLIIRREGFQERKRDYLARQINKCTRESDTTNYIATITCK